MDDARGRERAPRPRGARLPRAPQQSTQGRPHGAAARPSPCASLGRGKGGHGAAPRGWNRLAKAGGESRHLGCSPGQRPARGRRMRRTGACPAGSHTHTCTRALLAADLWASRRLGVCAAEGSPCAAARPLLRLVEVSGHGLPWLLGTAYGLWRSGSAAAREVLLNLLFALLLDLVLVAVVKGLVRRPRPAHNKMDMFATISVDKYSFPSGHATRAALVCRFVLHHLVLAAPLRVLVVLWALVVSLSRVMLGRHNVTDVLFGLLLGYALYSVVQYCWLSPLSAPALFALWSH
uniref:Polyisoprenoid diphosphate/phosphate phosphohydrolase PLPP6 n=1 Tax=Nothoprocta perdicaria TaxID=30464 RepID=A0A8C6YSS5_NOTPE